MTAAMTFTDMSLDQLGAQANAHYRAGEKANQKAGEHAKSAGLYLAEAQRRIAETTPYGQRTEAFETFVTQECPDIKQGVRRCYQLIAHATGKKPLEEVRKENRTSKQEARAKVKAALSFEGRPAKVQQTLQPPEPDPRAALMARIIQKLEGLSLAQLHDIKRLIPEPSAANSSAVCSLAA
jgi:hypothetical protein